jgi:hypothetical protein
MTSKRGSESKRKTAGGGGGGREGGGAGGEFDSPALGNLNLQLRHSLMGGEMIKPKPSPILGSSLA